MSAGIVCGAIELSDEQLVTLGQACRKLPQKPAPSTLWRWRTKGVLIKGRRVKLECIRVGGVWMTHAGLFEKFLRELTSAALSPEPSVSTSERSQETEQRLAAAGLIQPIKNAEQTK